MTTALDKALKRSISVDGKDYTVVIDQDGLRMVGKGKRKAEVELRWRDLLNGEAAMAVALQASLSQRRGPGGSVGAGPAPGEESTRSPKVGKRQRPGSA
jgi:hypothetical protein